MIRSWPIRTYLFVILSLAAPKLLATQVAAKKAGVPVLSEARKDAKTLLELKEGQSLKADIRSGMYWQVTLPSGEKGYVSVMAVQHQADEPNGIQSELRDIALEARRTATETDTVRSRSGVMGVRGLDESQDVSSAGGLRPDTAAVFIMEDRKIDPKRVQGIGRMVQEEVEQTLKSKTRSKAEQP